MCSTTALTLIGGEVVAIPYSYTVG
jgi:hypothetical protein